MKIFLGFKVPGFILAAAFAGMGIGTTATAQERPYFIDLNTRTVTGFGSLGGGNTRVADVNEFGEVVGTSRTATGGPRFHHWP